MQKAVIDIGSNSIKMMMFSKREDLKDPKYLIEITQLAKALSADDYLEQEAINRSVEVLKKYRKMAGDEVYAFATEALRRAKNADDFCKAAREVGVEIEIIPAEQEAELSFLGVRSQASGEIAMIDIGGASTEICVGDQAISYRKSFPVGVVKRLQNPLEDLETIFKDLPEVKNLYGVGGSISTMVSMRDKISDVTRPKIHQKVLSLFDIKKMYNELLWMNQAQRQQIVGLPEKRSSSIICGMEILLFLMKKLKQENITVSAYGAMDGYILSRGLIDATK